MRDYTVTFFETFNFVLLVPREDPGDSQGHITKGSLFDALLKRERYTAKFKMPLH